MNNLNKLIEGGARIFQLLHMNLDFLMNFLSLSLSFSINLSIIFIDIRSLLC